MIDSSQRQVMLDHLPASRVALTAALMTALIGVTVLIGWLFDLPRLVAIVPGSRVMVPNTGVAFIACGVAAVVLLHVRASCRWSRVAVRVGLVTVIALGVTTILEYLVHASFGVEYWFGFHGVRRVHSVKPSTPTVPAAIQCAVSFRPRSAFRSHSRSSTRLEWRQAGSARPSASPVCR
jgi:hypothetical protein